MSDRTDIKVFIASSKELKDERDETNNILEKLNSNFPHLHLVPVKFDLTGSGNRPGEKRLQDDFNKLLEGSQIVLVIFYSFVGQFTKEELDLSLNMGKKVFVYFKKGFTPESAEIGEKYTEVLKLKEKLGKEGNILPQEFIAENYGGFIYQDLDIYLKQKYPFTGLKTKSTDNIVSIIENSKINFEKLPLYSNKLIDREDELQMLDKAWENQQCNIVVLKASGGVGKTALTGYWLTHNLQPRDYAGARWVYAWSFYRQGASEGSQSSADQFIDEALKFFEINPIPANTYDKAHKLAKVISEKRGLLIIDGLEPLQYPASEITNKEKRTGLEGELKDKAMQALLKQLAANNEGLCVISTRLDLKALQGFKEETVKLHDLNFLSPEAGVELLKSLGVKGKDTELLQAAKDLKGHALTLKLFANLLREYFDGDIRKRDKIKDLTDDTQEGGHAWRVMTSYITYINKAELSLLYLIGLFDRPSRLDVLDKMIHEKAALEITAELNSISREELQKHIHHLERLGLLLTNEYENIPLGLSYQCLKGLEKYESIDAHPLVREFFGRQLQAQHPETYRQANLFLYEYYKSLPEKELPDTLAEMEPLFLAVVHGCHAGKQQESLDEMYWKRIHRGEENYLIKKLGAFGSNLACLSHFFDEVWELPSTELNDRDKSIVLSWAGHTLRALGRFEEAAQVINASLEKGVKQENWRGSAVRARNISELLLTSGNVAQAVDYGKFSVEYADKSKNEFEMRTERTGYANALYHHNESDKSLSLFAEAEEMLQKREHGSRYLYSLSGYQYCDLLLSNKSKAEEVIIRAKEGLKISERNNWLLEIGLAKLSLGNACMAKYIYSSSKNGKGLKLAKDHLDQAVEGLRKAGAMEKIPLGLFARSAYYRITGDYAAAEKDLQEALEIAEYGNMRLYYVDYHIEKMRLSKAQGNLIEAEKHRQIAKELIVQTGYLRRSKEVEEI